MKSVEWVPKTSARIYDFLLVSFLTGNVGTNPREGKIKESLEAFFRVLFGVYLGSLGLFWPLDAPRRLLRPKVTTAI